MPAGRDLTQAAAAGQASVVWIQNQDENQVIDTNIIKAGSGVIISADGYIVTNQHVIQDNELIHITLFDKRTYVAKFIGADTAIDVALIKIDAQNLPFVSFGNSDSVLVGEQVIAVGNPYRFQSTVTSGIVSAKGRPMFMPGSRSPYFIQTDVPILNGNSGGALLNAQGELIGINIGYVTVSGAYEGISFSIPGNIVKNIADQIREFTVSRKGSLTMSIRNVNKDDANAAGMNHYEGVVIDAMQAGSAADKAGLLSLDIITAFNGQPVLGRHDFLEKLHLSQPGDLVKMDINRGGKKMVVEVELE